MTEWNDELEKKILKRSRYRLTAKILRVLLIAGVVFGVYSVVIDIAVSRFHVAEESDYYTKLALDWKVPNVRGNFDFTEGETSLLGTKELTYSLFKRIGKEDVIVGEIDVRKTLTNSNSSISYRMPRMEQLNEFSFFYPEDPRSGNELNAPEQPEVWETLDMLHEGTVGELAFSTDRMMAPEELMKILQPYDVDILWMQLHTGEFTGFRPGASGSSADDLSVFDALGLTGARSVSDDYLSSMLMYALDEDTIEESKTEMIKNMGRLLDEKDDEYIEFFLGLSNLQERHEYLKNEGFTVYGAVVTGPVKELLRLEAEESIRGEQLGKVELWNWEDE